MGQHRFHGLPVVDDQKLDAVAGSGSFQRLQFLGRQRQSVEYGPRALPLEDGGEEIGSDGPGRRESNSHDLARCGIEEGFGSESVRQRRLHQILRDTTQRDKKMMVVRVG